MKYLRRYVQYKAPFPLLAIILVTASTALAAAQPEHLAGFGNIPFGTLATKALALNNGNGIMEKIPGGSEALVYPILVAGMDFQVTQHFTEDDKASDAEVRYASGEAPYPCIARFNYVLAHLNQRYGKPDAPPSFRREETRGRTDDHYMVTFGFADESAIQASAETDYPTPVSHKAGTGAAPATPAAGTAATAAASDKCHILLRYLPPRWETRF